MRNYIILNGKNSTDINGLLIQELPPISKPMLRTEVEEIAGRDGDIITPLGYAAYTKTITIGLYGNYDIDEVIGYFNGSGTVTFSNEEDKYYNYQIIDQIDFDRLLKFRTATVDFHVQPFKYSLAEAPIEFESSTVSGKGTNFKINSAEGVISDFKLYGNTEQVTTPTTTSTVPIKVVTGSNNLVIAHGDNSLIFPYNLGNVELSRLKYETDIFQDYIYYKNGNWYLHKDIGRFDIDTSQISEISNYSNIAYASIPIPTDSLGYGTSQSVPCLCTNAIYSHELAAGWNTDEAENLIFTHADSATYWLGFAAGTTLSQMRTALSGAVIYYPLDVPTDTEITDQALINVLNGILQSNIAGGLTTIKSTVYTRAQPVYFVRVKSEETMVTNIGNIYARPIITIYGTGLINVFLNNAQIFTINLIGSGYITIDTAKMEAYAGGILMNRQVTGSYDNFILNVGANKLSFSGNVERAMIAQYSRWL